MILRAVIPLDCQCDHARAEVMAVDMTRGYGANLSAQPRGYNARFIVIIREVHGGAFVPPGKLSAF